MKMAGFGGRGFHWLASCALLLALAACGGGGSTGHSAAGTDPGAGSSSGTGSGTGTGAGAGADGGTTQPQGLSVWAGTPGQTGDVTVNPWGYVNGVGSVARFYNPYGLIRDSSGNLFVADTFNHVIRKISVGGVVSTVAGTGAAGAQDGPVSSAQFNFPAALAMDAGGNLLVADRGNRTIRKIATDGTVSTVAGVAGAAGQLDGQGGVARFDSPTNLAMGPDGTLYVQEDHRVSKVSPAGVVSTLWTGSDSLMGLAVDSKSTVYVSSATVTNYIFGLMFNDQKVSSIVERRLSPLAGTPQTNSTVGAGNAYRVYTYFGALAVDAGDRLHVLVRDQLKGKVSIARVSSLGDVTSVQEVSRSTQRFQMQPSGLVVLIDEQAIFELNGMGAVLMAGSDAPIQTSYGPFSNPQGIAADSAGNLWVSNQAGGSLIKVNGKAEVRVVVDGGMTYPTGVTTDCEGNTYVADSVGNAIYRYTAAGAFSKVLDMNKFSTAALAMTAIAVDCSSNLYITNAWNNNVLKVLADGSVNTLAGPPLVSPMTRPGPSGSADGAGAVARFTGPGAIAVDAVGGVYVADSGNHTVRKISREGVVTTLAGQAGVAGSADGQAAAASFNGPSALALDGTGNLYVLDKGNNLVRRISPSGLVSTVAGTRGATALQLGALPGAWINSVGLAVAGNRLYVLADHAVLTFPLP